MKIRSLALLLVVSAGAGCPGIIPAAIDSLKSEQAESAAEEKAELRRQEERKRTKECLALLRRKELDFDAGLVELRGLVVKEEKDLEAADARWRRLEKETLNVPSDCSRSVTLSDDAESRAYQEEVFVPRLKAFEALQARVHEAHTPTIRMLLQKGIQGKAPRRSRTLLFPLYNQDVNTRNEELEGLAQEIGAQYDAQLLATFRKYGGYGRLGASANRVGCVFSAEPWPEDLDAIGPGFQTHFSGKGTVVNVLGRLPLAAHHYGGRDAGELIVQLISDTNGFVDVGESVSVGRPELLGDTPYVRAAFELPPRRFDHSRYFFDVRVVLRWRGGSQVLSQSSFTWQAS